MTNTRPFRREEAARLLQSQGLKTTSASLATMATRGGGPKYFKQGKLTMYWLSDLESWLAQRRTGPFDSTSSVQGKQFDSIVATDIELEDDPFYTGQSGFDEVTRLLDEERAMQDFIDTASVRYDKLLS